MNRRASCPSFHWNVSVRKRPERISGCSNAFAPLCHAVTKETFSGTLCESVYGPTTTLGANVAYQYGAIINRSRTDWAYVDCPVPRANGNTSGTIRDLEVSITDSEGNMWCTAVNYDRFGTSVASETVYSSGTGNRILDFGTVAGSSYEGYISVFCVIPKNGGRINSIAVDLN